MTNPTPHGQVPEVLIDLIDAYAETRHRCGGIYNAKTEAARNAVIEALSGVQALSAGPAIGDELRDTLVAVSAAIAERDDRAAQKMISEILAASTTPPAEQQATKETSGGFHVWRDISTAPKDGSRFVAIGYNYGLYSEGRHICVAQWFRGCWMETSDWNEASELQHLTHWLPLPSPPDNAAELNDLDVSVSPQQAAPKAAPGESEDSDGFGSAEHWKEKAQYWAGVAHRLRGEALRGEPVDGIVHPPAPQQEAQEPSKAYAWVYVNKYGVESIPASKDWCTAMVSGHGGSMFPLYTAPQPVARETLTPERVKEIVRGAGYDQCGIHDTERAAFINGLRHGEREHGIKGGQHGTE